MSNFLVCHNDLYRKNVYGSVLISIYADRIQISLKGKKKLNKRYAYAYKTVSHPFLFARKNGKSKQIEMIEDWNKINMDIWLNANQQWHKIKLFPFY